MNSQQRRLSNRSRSTGSTRRLLVDPILGGSGQAWDSPSADSLIGRATDGIGHLDFTPACEAERCHDRSPAELVCVLILPCCSLRAARLLCWPCAARNLTDTVIRRWRCRYCGVITSAIKPDHLTVRPIGPVQP